MTIAVAGRYRVVLTVLIAAISLLYRLFAAVVPCPWP